MNCLVKHKTFDPRAIITKNHPIQHVTEMENRTISVGLFWDGMKRKGITISVLLLI